MWGCSRVEILGDQLFYAIKQKIIADQFNYCAAAGCHLPKVHPEQECEFDFCTTDPTAHIELFVPTDDIVAQEWMPKLPLP